MPEIADFIVVIEDTDPESDTCGYRTWHVFRDKDEVIGYIAELSHYGILKTIVAQGVTQERANEICREIPVEVRFSIAYKMATMPNGTFSNAVFMTVLQELNCL